MKKIITIDGPVASGKSTVARLLAQELGFNYLTSGLLYRAIAYAILQDHASIESAYILKDDQLARLLHNTLLEYIWTHDGASHVVLNGLDITPFLKTYSIDACASHLAMRPIMREFTLNMQHALANKYNIVAEGRDLGSVVFPDACVKFFLTADISVRAKRWQFLQHQLGNTLSFSQAIAKVIERDKRDQERMLAPLIVPEKAIVIDGSCLTAVQVVQEMLAYIPRIMAEVTSL